jgi:UDP-N-acetylmuramoylalanine--D-glutamate ligase
VTGARLRAALEKRGASFPMIDCAKLDDAVAQARKHVTKDGVIVLSPAAPSFEEFKNFEERGKAFKAACLSPSLRA